MRVYYPQCRVNLFLVPAGESEPVGIEAIAPISVMVQKNSPNKADTFDVTFDAANFPANPAGIRDAVVDVRLAAMNGPGRELDTRGQHDQLIIGNIDSASQDRDRGTVKLSGRDYSALFLEEEWSDRRVELGRPLDEIVGEILESVPTAAALELVVALGGASPIVPKGKGQKGRYFAASASTSVWEALQDLAIMAGAIVLIRGDRVLLRPPRTASPESADPLPVFVDGFNLENLSIDRDFTTKDLPNVRVKATDPATRETIAAIWPDPPQTQVKVTRGGKGGTKREETTSYHNLIVRHPAPTPDILKIIARRVFEGWREQQLAASFATRELKVDAGRMGRPIDAFDWQINAAEIENGTAIRLHVDESTRRNVLERALTPEAKESELRRMGYRRRVAAALAEHWHTLDRIMYVDTATHTFTADEGYSLEVSAINAVEV